MSKTVYGTRAEYMRTNGLQEVVTWFECKHDRDTFRNQENERQECIQVEPMEWRNARPGLNIVPSGGL